MSLSKTDKDCIMENCSIQLFMKEKNIMIKTDTTECTLEDCPIGLFVSNNELCVKTEYGLDAYIVSSGEKFWGGATNMKDLANVMVTPCEIETQDTTPTKLENNTSKIISTWEWIGTYLLLSVPVLNILMAILFAIDKNVNPTKRNLAKAVLILTGVLFVLYIIMLFAAMIFSYHYIMQPPTIIDFPVNC